MNLSEILTFLSIVYLAFLSLVQLKYTLNKREYFFDPYHESSLYLVISGNVLMGISLVAFYFTNLLSDISLLLLSASTLWFLSGLFGLRFEKVIRYLLLALFLYLFFFSFGNLFLKFLIPIPWYVATNFAFIVLSSLSFYLFTLTGLKSLKFSVLSEGLFILLSIISVESYIFAIIPDWLSLSLFLLGTLVLTTGTLSLGIVDKLIRYIFLMFGFIVQGTLLTLGLLFSPISLYYWIQFLLINSVLPILTISLAYFLDKLLFNDATYFHLSTFLFSIMMLLYLSSVGLESFIMHSELTFLLRHISGVLISYILFQYTIFSLKEKSETSQNSLAKLDDFSMFLGLVILFIITLLIGISFMFGFVSFSNLIIVFAFTYTILLLLDVIAQIYFEEDLFEGAPKIYRLLSHLLIIGSFIVELLLAGYLVGSIVVSFLLIAGVLLGLWNDVFGFKQYFLGKE